MNQLSNSTRQSDGRSGTIANGFSPKIHFLLYQTGPLAIGITTLLVWPFLGVILSKELLGQLSLQLAIASIAGPGLSLGASLYLANILSKPSDNNHGAEKKTAIWLGFTLLTMAILTGSISVFAGQQEVLISISLSFANAAYLVTSGVMRGIDHSFRFATYTLLVQVTGLLALGTVASITNSLQVAVLFYTAIITLPVISQYFLLRGSVETVTLSATIPVLKKAKSLIPHLMLAVALLMMMRIIVAYLLGSIAVANYTFAALVIGGSLTIAASLDAHWSTRSQSSASLASLIIRLKQNQTKIHAVLALMCVLVILFLLYGLNFWLPPGYDHDPILWAVILALPAASMQAIADSRAAVLIYLDESRMVSAATAVGAFLTFLCAFAVLPVFGWPAAGMCITVGMFARMLATMAMASGRSKNLSIGKSARFLFASQILSIIIVSFVLIRVGF